MAANLCDTLEAGGLSVPTDIIITGYDAHLAALAHFPTITTIGGQSRLLGRKAVETLLVRLGETVTPTNKTLDLICGASCGCVDRAADDRTFLQVQAYVKKTLEDSERHEMKTTTNYIAKMSDIASLDDLIQAADQSAHVLDGFQTLDICLCEGWAGDVQAPEDYRSEGISCTGRAAIVQAHLAAVTEPCPVFHGASDSGTHDTA